MTQYQNPWFKSKFELFKTVIKKFTVPVIMIIIVDITYLQVHRYYDNLAMTNNMSIVLERQHKQEVELATIRGRVDTLEKVEVKIGEVSRVNYDSNSRQDAKISELDFANKELGHSILNIENSQDSNRVKLVNDMDTLIRQISQTNAMLSKLIEK